MESDRGHETNRKPEERLPPSIPAFPTLPPSLPYHMSLDSIHSYHGAYEPNSGPPGENSAPALSSLSSPSTAASHFLSSPHAHLLFPSTSSYGSHHEMPSFPTDRSIPPFPSPPLHHLPLYPYQPDQQYAMPSDHRHQTPPIPIQTTGNGKSPASPKNPDPSHPLPSTSVWSPKNVKRLQLRKGVIHPVSPEGETEPQTPTSARLRRSLPSSASSSPRPKGTSARTDPIYSSPISPKLSLSTKDMSHVLYQERVEQPLWVNYLPLHWQESDIEVELQGLLDANCKSVEKIQILSVKRVHDAPSERYARSLAVITLPTMKEAEAAMQILRHCKIEGKYLSLSFQPPAEPSDFEDSSSSATNTLFVANVHPSVTEDQIKLLFMQFGDVLHTIVVRNRHSSQSRGFAFVEFSEHASCELALRFMQNEMFCGQSLKLKLAKSSLNNANQETNPKSSTAPVKLSNSANAIPNRSKQSNTSPRTKRNSKSNTDTVTTTTRGNQRGNQRKGHLAVSSPRTQTSIASSLSPRSSSSLSASTDTTSYSNLPPGHHRRFSTSSIPHFSSPSQSLSESIDSGSAFASSEMFDGIEFDEPKNI